jgi:DNA mismatch repair protein MutH
LRADWEDLADLVANGLGFAITARRGRALQLRPKAANAGVTRRQRNVAGDDYDGRPQGFYLRRAFTQRIVDDVFSPK